MHVVGAALRARVWGLSQSLAGGLRPVGSLAAGLLADAATPGAGPFLAGILLAGLAVWVWRARPLDGRGAHPASPSV